MVTPGQFQDEFNNAFAKVTSKHSCYLTERKAQKHTDRLNKAFRTLDYKLRYNRNNLIFKWEVYYHG